MITMPASVGVLFFRYRRIGIGLMAQILARLRKASVSLLCALALVFTCLPAAYGAQNSTSQGSSKKPTTTRKHHKAASKTSATASASAGKTTRTATSGKRSSRKKRSARLRGQQKIDSERARSIQEALIREHYLSGEATGTWNQSSEDAMRRYQADHGWQSKTVPDSRALISLGLGPSKDHLLNPESAMTSTPQAPRSETIPTTSHSSPASTDPLTPTSTPPTDAPNPQ